MLYRRPIIVKERPLVWHIFLFMYLRFVPDDIRMERPKHVVGILVINQLNAQNLAL